MAGETIGWRAPADLGGLRQDPTYNRVSNHIHSAVGQFDVVLTGNAYCESGDVIPLFRSVSEGRIKDEKLRVHLYLLPDDWKTGNPQSFFPEVHAKHHPTVCRLFQQDPAQLKRLPDGKRY